MSDGAVEAVRDDTQPEQRPKPEVEIPETTGPTARPWLPRLAALGVAVGLLAGCGGDEPEEPDDSTGAETPAVDEEDGEERRKPRPRSPRARTWAAGWSSSCRPTRSRPR